MEFCFCYAYAMKPQKDIIKFLHEAEKLKSILRHSWLSSGRRESTAEHTWRMALMAILLRPYLKNNPDLSKTLRMVLVHDLVEVYAGDIPAWARDKSRKRAAEDQAMKKLSKILNNKQGQDLYRLWKEYQNSQTLEAKFAKALDRLEAKLQHQEADVKHLNSREIKFNLSHGQKETEFDPFLKALWEDLRGNWLKIYRKNKINPKLYQ